MTIRIKRNRSTTFEQSVINYWRHPGFTRARNPPYVPIWFIDTRYSDSYLEYVQTEFFKPNQWSMVWYKVVLVSVRSD